MEMANDTPVFKNVQDKIQLLIFLLDYWRFNFKLNYKNIKMDSKSFFLHMSEEICKSSPVLDP